MINRDHVLDRSRSLTTAAELSSARTTLVCVRSELVIMKNSCPVLVRCVDTTRNCQNSAYWFTSDSALFQLHAQCRDNAVNTNAGSNTLSASLETTILPRASLGAAIELLISPFIEIRSWTLERAVDIVPQSQASYKDLKSTIGDNTF